MTKKSIDKLYIREKIHFDKINLFKKQREQAKTSEEKENIDHKIVNEYEKINKISDYKLKLSSPTYKVLIKSGKWVTKRRR